MYPFGSGAPPMGGGYPQQPAGYPQQPAGYPQQTGYPQQPGYPSQGYPAQPGFQPQTSGGYPPQPGYPAQPGYQPQPSYPPQAQPGYPAAYPQQNYGAPQSTGPYPGAVSQAAPYPGAQTGMPGQQPFNYTNPSGVPPTGLVAQHYQGVSSGAPAAVRQGTPTVMAVQSDPSADAAALRKAMKGFGTDEDGIINVLCRRTNAQRQAIAKCFKTSYGKDLIDDIKSETSGNFEKLLVALLTPTDVFYAKELYEAIAGLGTDEDVLIDTMCTLSNREITYVKSAFARTYGQNLEDYLMSDTSGNFKRLMVSLCNASRDESGYVDPNRAREDANALLQAGKLQVGTDESTFNMILCQRSIAHLKQVFEQYQQLSGKSLEKSIKSEFSGDIETGLLAIVRCVTDRAEFFAKCLHNSMAGIGTKDQQLIRLVATRCEVDMQDIKVAFERKYGKSLKSFIKGDTSGHYRHALYALIGENKS